MKNYSDEQLIEVFQTTTGNQSQKAFDYLYSRYAEALTQYFYYAFRRDYSKGKDFAQDLFLKLLENPQKFDLKRKFKPWIYQVAANQCKNEYRKLEVVSKYKEHTLYTSDHHYQLDEEQTKLRDCIKNLKQEHRSLIVLRFKLNMTVKEIAAIYECPEGTVKSRLFYATKELAKHYKD